ncbi:hypothetical protein D3C72_1356790 [compost metagenome]
MANSGSTSGVTMPVARYVPMVTASIDRLKFWMMARCLSFSKPRRVHQSVGKVPANPPMPASTPPENPTVPSATRPPAVIFGMLRAISMAGHHNIKKAPSIALNQSMSKWGSTATPSGMPANPPSTKGANCLRLKPRRTVTAASTWPTSAPNTARVAAKRGSSAQAQNDIATSPKPKPDRPCTNPAATAPSATTRYTDSIVILELLWVPRVIH